ncbi:MAG: IS3 family transposase [Clostridia bacterium]|nr:IS3 family transposase [Clostridia bacterium]
MFKKGFFYRREYDTINEVERYIFYYIEIVYNRKRLHSNPGYMSPVAYRLKKMEAKAV